MGSSLDYVYLHVSMAYTSTYAFREVILIIDLYSMIVSIGSAIQ
jgi:hypothetical protein